MSALPDFTGPGFFAGEAPDGLTTIAGTPTSASVRVYWRDPADPDAPDVLVAQTTSAPDGTWRITGLNPALSYVVRAQKSNFDDATVVGARPSRSDVITYVDHLEPTEDFDGLMGYVLLDSGLTPFTCEVIQPLPYGLSARIEGRKLLIEGVSSDSGLWESVVRVTASNGVWVDVPVQVRIVWTPASLTVMPKIWLDDSSGINVVNGKVASWQSRGSVLGAFTQSAAAAQPVQSGLNGRKVVEFDGIDDVLVVSSGSLLNVFRSVGSGWVFVVAAGSMVGYQQFFEAGTAVSSGTTRIGVGILDDAPYLVARRLDSVGAQLLESSVQMQDAAYHIICGRVDWAGAAASISVDAAHLTTSSAFLTKGLTQNTASSRLTLGASVGFAYAKVKVAAVIAGAGSFPSAAELQKLEGWAAHRYGLTDLLPADHPYKEVAP